MNCINFNEIYRDFLQPDEEQHVKACIACRLQWQQQLAIINQPLDEILEEMRDGVEQKRSSIDWILSILSQTLPSSSPLLEQLSGIAEKAARLLPQANPEQIAAAMAHFDKKEIGGLSEDAFLEKLKREIDTDNKEKR